MSAAQLILPPPVAAELLAHARSELPNEACGLLAGDPTTGAARAFHAARNAHASPLRYDVHPEDLVRIMFDIERRGDQLLAVFHSHPRSPAVPSATDLREARYPVIQLLAGMGDPADEDSTSLRAWRLEPNGAREVAVRIG